MNTKQRAHQIESRMIQIEDQLAKLNTDKPRRAVELYTELLQSVRMLRLEMAEVHARTAIHTVDPTRETQQLQDILSSERQRQRELTVQVQRLTNRIEEVAQAAKLPRKRGFLARLWQRLTS